MTTNRQSTADAAPDRERSGPFVVGGSAVGERVAEELAASGAAVTFVDQSPPRDPPPGGTVVVVDDLDAASLDDVGIADASVVLVLGADDATNLLVAQLARSRFGVDRVVVRVNDPRRAPAFDGVDVETVDATTVLGGAVADLV